MVPAGCAVFFGKVVQGKYCVNDERMFTERYRPGIGVSVRLLTRLTGLDFNRLTGVEQHIFRKRALARWAS